MKKEPKSNRRFLTKPGDTIVDSLKAMKMSQAELAERMGKTASKVNDIISGKEPITMNTALLLENVLGIEAAFWLARETTYRERLARIEEEEKLVCSIPWAKLNPLQDLHRCGIVKTIGAGVETVKELLLFYGVGSEEQWRELYAAQQVNANYRKSEAYTTEMTAVTAWLRVGEREMKKIALPEFDKELFKTKLEKARKLVRKKPEEYVRKLQDECEEAGVALVYTPCFSKAPISGAARWIGGNPLIQMTDRYKRNDHFWFTFFHEAGHVLLHGKKEVFLESVDEYDGNEEKENEANDFASRWLLPDEFLQEVSKPITNEWILNIAERYEIHPGIVVARLQKKKILEYWEKNEFKEKLSLFE
jgi:addiction module HigA family antidote